jgi:hypothetical protein
MNEHNDELSAGERRALDELAREAPPPPAVEKRILAALAGRGLLRAQRERTRSRAWLPATAAAAALVLFAAGFALGRGSGVIREAAPGSPRFALFLLRGEERLPQRPEEEAGRVEEYRAWAQGLAGAGRFVTGEKLEDRAERVASSRSTAAEETAVSADEIRGFFIVSATDLADALAVARGCPHLRYGGRILVRPIAPV